jgi:hypothetical protein
LGLIFECLQALLAGIKGMDQTQQELPEQLDHHGMPQAIYFAMLLLLPEQGLERRAIAALSESLERQMKRLSL